MEMTKGEITRAYRESSNKTEQIKILADLNECSRADIEKILKDAGHEIPKRGRKPNVTKTEEPKRAKIKPKTAPKTEEKVDFTQCEAIEPVEEEIEEVEEMEYPEEEKAYMPVSVWETLQGRIIELDRCIADLQKEKAEIEQYIELNK